MILPIAAALWRGGAWWDYPGRFVAGWLGAGVLRQA